MRTVWIALSWVLASPAWGAPVRVATWNLESLGAPGSVEHEAAVDVLARIDADVVLLQEINGSTDATYVASLAASAGYAHTFTGPGSTFGGMRNAALSRLPFVDARAFVSADLSPDPSADELTRDFVRVTVDVGGTDLTLMSLHLKSSSSDEDEFRRAVEGLRVGDALADLDLWTDAVVVAGDLNDEVGDVHYPATFTAPPAGLPASYVLGSDLAALLPSPGIEDTVFDTLFGLGLTDPGAWQLDGQELTRPSSGRRLDYVLVSDPLLRTPPETQVYDSSDEGRAGGLPLYGRALPASTSADASDHLPVLADLDVPAGGGGAARPAPGDLLLTEFMANPSTCADDTGEWIELYNARFVPLDLSGLEIVDQSGNVAVVAGPVTAPARSLVLLGRTDAARFCGPARPDGFYGDAVYLNNTSDALTFRVNGTVVLQTPVYPAAGATSGVSAQRDPARPRWCLSTSPIGAELGTPGTRNVPCP